MTAKPTRYPIDRLPWTGAPEAGTGLAISLSFGTAVARSGASKAPDRFNCRGGKRAGSKAPGGIGASSD